MAISSRFSAPRRRPALTGKAHLEHVGYGTMNGADGKPFKTRAGGVMKLYDLIAMAVVEAKSRLAEQGLGARLFRRGTRGHRQADRHRHHQIRRSLQSPHHGLYFRPGAVSRNSKARPGPICNMRRCASNPSCARRATRAMPSGTPAIHSPEERDSGAAASVAGRRHAGGGTEARAQYPVRLCLHPGAEFQPLLCRPPHPVRIGRGAARPTGWAFARGCWR